MKTIWKLVGTCFEPFSDYVVAPWYVDYPCPFLWGQLHVTVQVSNYCAKLVHDLWSMLESLYAKQS